MGPSQRTGVCCDRIDHREVNLADLFAAGHLDDAQQHQLSVATHVAVDDPRIPGIVAQATLGHCRIRHRYCTRKTPRVGSSLLLHTQSPALSLFGELGQSGLQSVALILDGRRCISRSCHGLFCGHRHGRRGTQDRSQHGP